MTEPLPAVVALTELDYYKLRVAIADADLAPVIAQAQVNIAIAKRDALALALATKQGVLLPAPIASIEWNDSSFEFRFT